MSNTATPNASWKRNGFRIIADRPRANVATHLADCPRNWERVAIFTPAGHLSHVKFGERIDGRVFIRLFEQRVEATPCAAVPHTGEARYRVTMPAWEVEP
jgi:hypothetical protein